MFHRVIPDLISLAETSTMTSKHAAAVISGKRVLSTATNYPLPANELVNTITTRVHEHPPSCRSFNRTHERCEHCSQCSLKHTQREKGPKIKASN